MKENRTYLFLQKVLLDEIELDLDNRFKDLSTVPPRFLHATPKSTPYNFYVFHIT